MNEQTKAEVFEINRETLLGFVEREGVVNTSCVEYRFGLTNKEARTQLQALANAGLIIKDGRRGLRIGAIIQWRRK